MSFEIGCIYRGPRSKYFLAASKTQVLCAHKGVLKLKAPEEKSDYVRCSKATVDDLCSSLKVSVEDIDSFMGNVNPPAPPTRTRPRGDRPCAPKEDDAYKHIRMVKAG